MIQKTDGDCRNRSIENKTNTMSTRVKRGSQKVKTEFFSVRDSRTVNLNLNVLYISQYK